MRDRPQTIAVGGRQFVAPLRRSEATELLDQPVRDPDELDRNLRDIRRLNRFFGGASITVRHLVRLIEPRPVDQPVAILDLATGSADIPLAICRWAATHGRLLTITASDVSDQILAIAEQHVVGHPAIALARYDARSVPLPDRSVDLVLCSLALHHFDPADAILVLQEMDRLARLGFVVNDLARSRLGFVAAWLASRLTTRNRLTRHDAPLSVRRAYTGDELRDLLNRAGIADAVVTTHPWFRMAAVKRMDGSNA